MGRKRGAGFWLQAYSTVQFKLQHLNGPCVHVRPTTPWQSSARGVIITALQRQNNIGRLKELLPSAMGAGGIGMWRVLFPVALAPAAVPSGARHACRCWGAGMRQR